MGPRPPGVPGSRTCLEDSNTRPRPHSKSVSLGTPCETSHLSELWAKKIFKRTERKISGAVQKRVRRAA